MGKRDFLFILPVFFIFGILYANDMEKYQFMLVPAVLCLFGVLSGFIGSRCKIGSIPWFIFRKVLAQLFALLSIGTFYINLFNAAGE